MFFQAQHCSSWLLDLRYSYRPRSTVVPSTHRTISMNKASHLLTPGWPIVLSALKPTVEPAVIVAILAEVADVESSS